MPKVKRSLVFDGGYSIIEHALCAEGHSPSALVFEEIKAGRWEEDPELENIPDDAQISHFDKFRVGIEHFAQHGYPNNQYCTINNLDDGIWEFKRAAMRISFFDTDGLGGYVPKLRIRDINEVEEPDEFWWLPTFDVNIRLGHSFGKNSQRTEQHDIDETIRIRDEDLVYDQAPEAHNEGDARDGD